MLNVRRNKASQNSIQFLSPIGTKGFLVYKEANIEENKSDGSAIQVAYPQSEQVAKRILGSKVQVVHDTDVKNEDKEMDA